MTAHSVRRVAANTGSIVSAQILTKVVSTLFLLFVARHLGRYGFGEYAFAFGVVSILLVLCDFGLGTLSVRELARDRERADAIFSANLGGRLLLAAAAIALLQLAIPWLRLTAPARDMLQILQLLLVVQAFTGSYGVVFNAYERMHYPQLLNVMQTVTVAAAGTAVLLAGGGLTGIAWAAAAAGGGNIALAAWLMRHRVRRLRWRFDRDLTARLLRRALPFGLTGLLALIYFRTGLFFLQVLDGPGAVGAFAAAFKILEACFVVPAALNAALFPHLSRSAQGGVEAVGRAVERAFRYYLVLGLPLTAAIGLFAEPIVTLLFSDRFAGSVEALRLLALGIVPLFLNSVLGIAAFSLNRERIALRIATAMIAASALLHALLVPRYGITGAAWATIVTQYLFCVVYIVLVSRWLPGLRLAPALRRPMTAAIALVPPVLVGRSAAAFAVSIGLYGVLLVALGGVDSSDATLLRRIVHPSGGTP